MRKRLFFSLWFFVKVALATILPLVLFALPSAILDKRLSTTPSLTVVGLTLSVIATVLITRKIALSAVKKLNRMD